MDEEQTTENTKEDNHNKPIILCIPRVRSHISKSRIWQVLQQLNMGVLERIDVVRKQTERGDTYNRVFIHYRNWNDSKNACEARARLSQGLDIKVIHDLDAGFHWKISAYRKCAS